MNIADIRIDYTMNGLSRADLDPDPVTFFAGWFQSAVDAGVHEPNAMVLSTIRQDNSPASRIVLLKGIEQRQFVFFTNYQSAKASEMAAHDNVALNFFWPQLERQVRISGHCQRIPQEQSIAYFKSRPRSSQIGAWASHQSEPIDSRKSLEDNFHQLTTKWEGCEIPYPEHWGGFGVTPTEIEFWQGRVGRLHDRFLYQLSSDSDSWIISRLNP